MFRKTVAIMLSGVLLSIAFAAQTVRAQSGKDSRLGEEARASISKLGVGKDARVEIRLRDNTKLKGYVSQAGDESFTVTDSKTGASNSVAYAEVAQVKKKGGGLSTGTKAMIWGGVGVGVAIVLYSVRGAFCDGMC